MKKSSLTGMFATTGVAALVLSGCASSGPASDGTIALTLTDTMSETSAPIYDEIYQACAADLGIEVTSTHVAGKGLIAKVLQQASSKTLPDVLMLDNPDVQQIASSGALSPLSDYAIDTDGYAEGALEAGTYEGELYGLAPVVNSLGLFYNVDLFDEAGIAPPTTWEELSTAAATLSVPGERYGIAFSAANSFEGTFQFLPHMWTNGGTEDKIDGAETVQALEFIDSLVADGSASESVVAWSQNDVNDQFIAGNAAMMVNGPWNMPSLLAATDLNFSSVPLPTRTADQVPVAPLGGETFTVPVTGDEATMAAAGDFVGCITSDEHQLTMATGRGAVPSKTSVAEEAAAANPLIDAFVSTVQTARARTALLGEDWPEAATRIYTAVQLALTDKLSPEDALKQAQAE